MEQDRWKKENNAGHHKHFMSFFAFQVLVVAFIGVLILSCEKAKVKELSLDKSKATMLVGDSEKLYVTVLPQDIHPDLLWKSSDESVAKVDSGIVTGLKTGRTKISVTVKDQADMTAECEYLIEEPSVDMETLDILEEPIVLRPGGHQQMNVRVTPENQTENILWTSSNESVARVNPRGKVEAIKIGYAYIIAVSDRTGVTDSALVSVEGHGTMPNMGTGHTGAAPASKPASVVKQASAVKTTQTTVTKTVTKTPVKTTPAQTTKPVQTAKSGQTAKPVTKTPVKSSASGTKNLGYANFRGSWPNDVNGRMEFTSTHVIDSKDPKNRMASPGDYVIGEWSDGHLVQGIWYGSDNQVKGSILIGK